MHNVIMLPTCGLPCNNMPNSFHCWKWRKWLFPIPLKLLTCCTQLRTIEFYWNDIERRGQYIICMWGTMKRTRKCESDGIITYSVLFGIITHSTTFMASDLCLIVACRMDDSRQCITFNSSLLDKINLFFYEEINRECMLLACLWQLTSMWCTDLFTSSSFFLISIFLSLCKLNYVYFFIIIRFMSNVGNRDWVFCLLGVGSSAYDVQ